MTNSKTLHLKATYHIRENQNHKILMGLFGATHGSWGFPPPEYCHTKHAMMKVAQLYLN